MFRESATGRNNRRFRYNVIKPWTADGKSVTLDDPAAKHAKSRVDDDKDRLAMLGRFRGVLSIGQMASVADVAPDTVRAWLAIPGSRRYRRIPAQRFARIEIAALKAMNELQGATRSHV